MNNYRYALAKQRKKEIETHRYFLLFQEYLDLLETDTRKEVKKHSATKHRKVSARFQTDCPGDLPTMP